MLLPCQFDIAPHTPGDVSRLAQNVRGGKGNVPKCHEITFVIVLPSENCGAINQLDFFFYFTTGMAAVNVVLETLQSGDHVVASNQVIKSHNFTV